MLLADRRTKKLWVEAQDGGVEISARTYMTDDFNGAGTGDPEGTLRAPVNCPNCVADDFSDMYSQVWTEESLAATVTAKLVGPFSAFLVDASKSPLGSYSASSVGLVLNGPGPLVDECLSPPPPQPL